MAANDEVRADRTVFTADEAHAASGIADFDVNLATGAVRGARLNALLGYPDARLLTRDDVYARVHRDDAPALQAVVGDAAAGSPQFEREFRVMLPDGAVRWIHARGEVSLQGDSPTRIRGVCFDITDRKRSEDTARESESRYRALMQMSPNAILVASGGRYVDANDAAARLLRAASPRELIGRTPYELVSSDYHELLRHRMSQVLEQHASVPRMRYHWVRLDGSGIDVDVAAAYVQWGGEDAVQIVAHDITEEVLVEEALRESRALLADELEDATRLQSISTRLIEADDAGSIYRQLLKEAVRLMRAEGGSVHQVDGGGAAPLLIASEGLAGPSARIWQVVGAGATGGRALHDRQRIVVKDVDACELLAGTPDLAEFRHHRVRALQATPLVARDGTAVGVMSTYWRSPHQPSARELRLLDVLARQAADLLERYRAQERLAAVERRQSFLLAVSDELRQAADADDMVWRACRRLGEHLGVDRVHFGRPDPASGCLVIANDWFRVGLRSRAGAFPLDWFGERPLGALAGQAVSVGDVGAAPGLSHTARAIYAGLGIGAFIAAPVLRAGHPVVTLSIVSGLPREWTADELALAEAVAERVWTAVEHARTEEALRESREALRAFYDHSPLLMGIVEVQGGVVTALDANAATSQFFGVSRTATRAEQRLAMPPATDATWLAGYRRALHTQHPVRFEVDHGRVDSARSLSVMAVHLGNGVTGAQRFSFLAEDVTERRRFDAMAREGEARRAFLMSLDETLQPLASPGYIQREACRLVRRRLGADRVSFAEWTATGGLRVTAVDLGAGADPGPSEFALASYAGEDGDALHAGRVVTGARMGDAPGSHATADAPLLRNGRLVALVSAHREAPAAWTADELELLAEAAQRALRASDRARAYAALHESEERLRRVFEALEEGFAVCAVVRDEAGRTADAHWLQVNPAFARLVGRDAEDFAGQRLADVLPGVDAAWIDRLERVATTGQPERFEHEAVSLARWFDVTVLRYGPDELAVLLDDITGRRRDEAALRDSEQRMRALVENVRDYAIFMLDADGRVIEWTDGAARVMGYAAAEMLGRSTATLFAPEDVAAGAPRQVLDEAERIGRAECEGWRVCKGGKRIWVNEIATEVRGDDGTLRGFTMISRDLTERRRAEQALAEAARHKDEFLAILSHELRNPLAPISNSVYVLRHVAGGSDAAQHAQAVIERQTRHLARIVDDLLDVTRIGRGRIELRKDRIDLRDVVRRAGEDLRSVLEGRGIRFTVELPDARACCEADPTRVHQAIGNLLANAAKFTRPGDRVELALSVEAGEAQIRVSDTGAGIETELQPHLFTAFVQGERTLARSQGGLGLGLALVRGIVELHGGRVSVTSAGRDAGAEFVMTLPLAPTAPVRAADDAVPVRERRRLQVLVVDDNADAAESLAAIVGLLGHAVEFAYDGPGAIAKARECAPDVVLCDIGLPGMSGYEVARTLRSDPSCTARLVAVSGYAQPEDVRRSAAAGFDDHLAKPFDPSVLERLLH